MMKLFEIRVRVNKLPHKGGYIDDVVLYLGRKDVVDFGLCREKLTKQSVTLDGYIVDSIEYVNRELFTDEETQELREHLERYRGVTEVMVNEVKLPVGGDELPCAMYPEEACVYSYRFYEDSSWEGKAVNGYCFVGEGIERYGLDSYHFAPDGSVSGKLELGGDDTKQLFESYQKAIYSGKATTFERYAKLEPHKSRVLSFEDDIRRIQPL
jgi:hypothetical protein